MDFMPFYVSLKLSLVTTTILLAFCLPLANILAFKKFAMKSFVESLISLPIVLPPTVIGFYLLVFFSPRFFFGSFLENVFNIRLVFSFTGIVIASCIYSLPFMLQPLKNGMESLDRSLIDASYSLGKGRIETFFRIIIPNIKPNIITGLVITFAHTMGEFGVILMLGGNIPGVTRVASIAIYDNVEQMNYRFGFIYSIILVGISAMVLMILNMISNRERRDVV